jgi:hypothetical protein
MANPRRPRDINQLAKMIVDLSTRDETDKPEKLKKKAQQRLAPKSKTNPAHPVSAVK